MINPNYLILSFVLVPLLIFLTSLFIRKRKENTLSKLAFYGVTFNFISILVFIFWWLILNKEFATLNIKELVLYKSGEYEFVIDLYFDKTSAVYLVIGSFVSFLITKYSAYYMHLENGYKRFFNTILLFYFGYNLTVLSGNFETLFIGWEILGISSFLLIAFYRQRYLPIKNAVKVFSIYRIGDIGLMIAMWLSHHLWHENITFNKLHNQILVHQHLIEHTGVGAFIALCILLAACAKSAQLPFSSWLPRAMEGPTPSSAIFYGSLSVHFGVFLLIRTYPFWAEQSSIRIIIFLVGLATASITYSIMRVQTNIKTQIAYASIAQIGIMFIEVALGFENIALIHFAGNAFLRTYQLLTSPSIVSYKMREQVYHFSPHKNINFSAPFKKLKYTLYVFALNEFELDWFMNKFVFSPAKKIGTLLNPITIKNIVYVTTPIYAIGIYFLLQRGHNPQIEKFLPFVFGGVSLLMVMKSFSERKYPTLAFTLILINNYFIALAILFNENFSFVDVVWFLSGLTVAGIAGIFCLNYLQKAEPKNFSLQIYYGHVFEYPNLGFAFFLTCLGLMGFPITPSFIGEDIIIGHIHEHQLVLTFLYSSSYVLGGISLVRIFSRLFLGTHIKNHHPVPLKSA